MGFKWASLCGRPFEARVAFDDQIYCNSFVKGRPEAPCIKALKKQMVWPQNDELLAFLFLLFNHWLPTGFSLWKTI